MNSSFKNIPPVHVPFFAKGESRGQKILWLSELVDLILALCPDLRTKLEEYPRNWKKSKLHEAQQARGPMDSKFVIHWVIDRNVRSDNPIFNFFFSRRKMGACFVF
jgi:hypothetical protein